MIKSAHMRSNRAGFPQKQMVKGHFVRRPLRLQAMHPLVALAYYIGVFATLFCFDSITYTAALFGWMLLLACRTAGGRKTLRLLMGAALFGALLMMLNPLINGEGIHILFYLGERPVTLESLLYGAQRLLLFAALLLVFPSFNVLLDSERILYLFSHALRTSALILMMAMRFVPLLARRAEELRLLYRRAEPRRLARIRHAGRLLGALLDWTVEEGLQSARVLRARGYRGGKRTFYAAFRFTLRDAAALAVLAAAIVALVACRFCGAGKWLYFPAVALPAFDGVQAAGLVLLCLFGGYPFLLEAGSRLLCSLENRKRGELLV